MHACVKLCEPVGGTLAPVRKQIIVPSCEGRDSSSAKDWGGPALLHVPVQCANNLIEHPDLSRAFGGFFGQWGWWWPPMIAVVGASTIERVDDDGRLRQLSSAMGPPRYWLLPWWRCPCAPRPMPIRWAHSSSRALTHATAISW